MMYSLLNKSVSEYLAAPYSSVAQFADGRAEHSRPAPVPLCWPDCGAKSYELTIAEEGAEATAVSDRNSTSARLFSSHIIKRTVSIPHIDLYNCKTGASYRWSVTAPGRGVVAEGTFTTAQETPRAIFCDGVTNMRDLGGWKCAGGKRVRQGLLYRSGRLGKREAGVAIRDITDEGIATIRELGIRTELDLRRFDNKTPDEIPLESPVPGLNYIQIPMSDRIGGIFEDNPGKLPKVFDVLADPSNYPLLFHCTKGSDRTGFITYLVLGLLGVDRDDIFRDYLLSNFALIGAPRPLSGVSGDYIAGIDAFPGKTLSERIENYLLSLGISRSQLDTVRRLLT